MSTNIKCYYDKINELNGKRKMKETKEKNQYESTAMVRGWVGRAARGSVLRRMLARLGTSDCRIGFAVPIHLFHRSEFYPRITKKGILGASFQIYSI